MIGNCDHSSLDYSPITTASRISPADLKFLFPSAITTFSRIQTDNIKIIFSATPVHNLTSLLSLASKFHNLEMYCRVRRESTLSELQEIERIIPKICVYDELFQLLSLSSL